MPLPPIERKAAFAAAYTRNGKTKTAATREDLGVSWTHLEKVIEEERIGSPALLERFAAYIGASVEECWGHRAPARSTAVAV